MSHYLIIIIFVSMVCVFANIFTRPCLPTRINYRVHYTCLETEQGKYNDRIALLRGEPSSFARKGFYDRLFRCLVCYYTVLLRLRNPHGCYLQGKSCPASLGYQSLRGFYFIKHRFVIERVSGPYNDSR
ncbi:unnamed protein product [Angiostrongylus costaricensis]|uniref:Secreted protein n=1 Tax=Angiostrongylus costaricensis TaxID=334426 RepID=A0A0R3PLB1_ANGCS|nr:unnamed protein product [Angiostrongylus costaricensis]